MIIANTPEEYRRKTATEIMIVVNRKMHLKEVNIKLYSASAEAVRTVEALEALGAAFKGLNGSISVSSVTETLAKSGFQQKYLKPKKKCYYQKFKKSGINYR